MIPLAQFVELCYWAMILTYWYTYVRSSTLIAINYLMSRAVTCNTQQEKTSAVGRSFNIQQK